VASRPRLANRAREVRTANRTGGNSGDERGAGPKPSRWSAARRRSGCAGRPTLRKRGVARLRARQDKGYRLPALRHPLGRGSEAEKEGRTRARMSRDGETEDTNFVGWVERRARNPSNPVPRGPAMGVAVAQPILRRSERDEKEPGRSNARRERRRLRCLTWGIGRFVGWVERFARNPSKAVPALGRRWVSRSPNPSYELAATRSVPAEGAPRRVLA
jgi:hypothetical protein